MKTTTKWLVAICLTVLGGVADADAQMLQWEDRGYAAVNFGVQAGSQDFTEQSTPSIYGENATITVPHSVSGGGIFDIAAGYRVWRNLAIGLGFSTFGDSETATVTAQIPNPAFGGARRTATADTGELSHSEQAVHLQLYWNIPLTEQFEAAVVVGPSFYKIEQDVVASITPREGTPPFTTVAISSVEQATVSERATGFTAGVDLTYLVNRRYGAGAFLRFSGASADLALPGGGSITVDAGGFQLGGGLRVRF